MLQLYEKEGVTCVEMRNPLIGKVFAFIADGLLIDTGAPNMEAELIPFLEGASFDSVVLTHHHEDHSGLAPWIQENRDVPIYIHPAEIELCLERSPYPAYRRKTWGIREPFTPVPIGKTVQSRTQEWEVIHTPGHADDHIALFNHNNGMLFSGDLYVTPKTKVIMESESIPRIMESLRTVLAYDIGSVFCGHAGYMPNGKEKLKKKLEDLEELYVEVETLHTKGLTAAEITKALFPKNYPIISISEGEWDSKHVIDSILSDIYAY